MIKGGHSRLTTPRLYGPVDRDLLVVAGGFAREVVVGSEQPFFDIFADVLGGFEPGPGFVTRGPLPGNRGFEDQP